MITCPICRHTDWNGTFFCAECGTQLVMAESPTTHHIQRATTESIKLGSAEVLAGPELEKAAGEEKESVVQVSLHLVQQAHVMELSGQTEFTIGRSAEGQPILPDIDLAPYDAYNLGVSRLHASLKVQGANVQISDLGSSNGTRLNGQKIVPHVEYTLTHGDMVSLGKFGLQILISK